MHQPDFNNRSGGGSDRDDRRGRGTGRGGRGRGRDAAAEEVRHYDKPQRHLSDNRIFFEEHIDVTLAAKGMKGIRLMFRRYSGQASQNSQETKKRESCCLENRQEEGNPQQDHEDTHAPLPEDQLIHFCNSRGVEWIEKEYEWVAQFGTLVVVDKPIDLQDGLVDQFQTRMNDKTIHCSTNFSHADFNNMAADGDAALISVAHSVQGLLHGATGADGSIEKKHVERFRTQNEKGRLSREKRVNGDKDAKRRDEKQAIIVLPVSENSIGFRMKACVTRRGLVGVADLKENDPAEASGAAQPQIAETKTYSRDQSTLRLKWTGPFSNLQLDIRIIMIENERREDDSGTSRPTQYKIEVRPLPMTLPRGQTTNPGQLGVTANKQLLKGIWHQFAMDVVHIAGLLDDLPHDIAPVERYDFRFTSCLHDSKKEEEAEYYYCTKPRCAFEHHRVLCLNDSKGGVGCEVFPRCNYVHGYSRLRVALSIAPTLLGPERHADGLTLSLPPQAEESKSATIEWQKVNRSITTMYGRQLMRIIDLLHKLGEGPPTTDVIQHATNAISALHSFCDRVRRASTLAQRKAILRTHVGQDQPKQQKHKDPFDVSDSARVRVTVNLLTSDPSTDEIIQAKMDHNLVSAVALALNELLRPPTGQPIMSVAEFDERTAQLTLTLFAHREIEAPWKSSVVRLLAAVKKRDHHYRFSWDVGTCENTDVTDWENGKVRQVFDALANVDPLSKYVFDPLPVEAPCTKADFVNAVRDAVDTLDKINVNKFDKTKIDFDSVMDDIHLTGDSNKAEVLKAAVQTYTGVSGLYAKVNAVLRMRHELTKDDLFSGITPYMAIVLRGLQCTPQVKCDGPIYRGVSLTRSQHCQYVKDVSVVWNTITSCTVDEASAVKFAVGNYAPQNPIIGKTHPVTFVIESATCVDVHHMSQSKHEQEVILLPGTRLKVTKVTLEQVWFTQVC